MQKQIQIPGQTTINPKLLQVGLQIIVYKTQKSELLNYMKQRIKKVELSTVRKNLSKIKGPLSKEIIMAREERI